MKRKLRKFFHAVWGWFSPPHDRRPPQTQIANQLKNSAAGNLHHLPRAEQGTNRTMRAMREILSSRHAAEEQLVFTSISQDGVVIEKSEEWFRKRNSMRTVLKRSVVLTCSGEIVSPASIKLKCATCGGFDSSVARCAHPECGIALCRLHQRSFDRGSERVIFCQQHFQKAVLAYDTWRALDQENKRRS